MAMRQNNRKPRRRTGLIALALVLAGLAAAAVAVAGTRQAPPARAVADKTETRTWPSLPPQPLPEHLGEVALPRGWSVTKLAYRVYGVDDRRLLDTLSAANPGLTDLSKVEAGRRLVLPAVPAPMPEAAVRVLRVAEADSLDAALATVGTAPADWPRLRLCLSFHPETGLSRDVIVDAVYADAASAHRAAVALPAALASRVVIVEAFPPGTRLYSRLDTAPETTVVPPGENILAQRATRETRP